MRMVGASVRKLPVQSFSHQFRRSDVTNARADVMFVSKAFYLEQQKSVKSVGKSLEQQKMVGWATNSRSSKTVDWSSRAIDSRSAMVAVMEECRP